MSHLDDSDCEIVRKSKRKPKKITSSESEICIRTRRKTRFHKVHQKSSYVSLSSRITIQFHENLTIFFLFPSREPTSSSLLEDTQAFLQKNPLGGSSSNNNSNTSNQKTPNRLDVSNKLSQPSPTVNTKEAMNLMQELWGSSEKQDIAEPVAKPKFQIFQEPEPTPEPAKPKFQIFQDSAGPKASVAPPKPTFQVYEEPVVAPIAAAKPKFQIFQEPAAPNPKPKSRLVKPHDKENDLLKPNPDLEEYDEDNPKTMFVPSMEDFAKMAQAASTPFSGRCFMPEPDENTCAVDLLFKKPDVPANVTKKDDPIEVNEPPQEQQDNLQPVAQHPFNPMSPIMETSREHYKSSSTSSSNASFSKSNFTKSHWGNTHLATQNATPGTFLGSNKSVAGKQEFKPSEITANSGYMADSSSARTPGLFLAKKKPFVNSPSSAAQGKDKKLKYHQNEDVEDEEDEDYEPTGMVPEFQKEAAITETERMNASRITKKTDNSYLQESMVASFLQQNPPDVSKTNKSLIASLLQPPNLERSKINVDVTRPPTEDFEVSLELSPNMGSKPTLDLTKPTLDLTKPTLDLSKPCLDLSKPNLGE